jgi:holo-[acyl-carrier protein] synthase
MIRVGTDLVSITRIEEARDRFGVRFLNRYLHETEGSLATPPASLAGYWAAKEAIAKALGCGIGSELGFHDIVLEKDAKGAPSFRLSETAQTRFPIRESSLSISHDGGFAIAVAVIVLKAES